RRLEGGGRRDREEDRRAHPPVVSGSSGGANELVVDRVVAVAEAEFEDRAVRGQRDRLERARRLPGGAVEVNRAGPQALRVDVVDRIDVRRRVGVVPPVEGGAAV